MPPHGTVTRRAPVRAHAGARRATAPHHHRRVSGPVARPVPVTAPALPRRGGTGGFERLKALPEHRMVDRLLRGRAWIWVIGVMLGGIVAMQVSLLKLNSGISRAVEQAGTLERVNADLETQVARMSSSERIQATAERKGMVEPPAGDVGYLTVRPGADGRLAAHRMQPPSEAAQQVMASGGKAPAAFAPPTSLATTTTTPAATTTTTPAATTTTTPAATTTTTPTTTSATATTPAPTPVATATPAPVAAAPPAAAPTTGTGATTAPAG